MLRCLREGSGGRRGTGVRPPFFHASDRNRIASGHRVRGGRHAVACRRLGVDLRTIMDGTVLQFENLTLGYDRHPAVHHLDFGVRRGALVAVVGPNGAGKSTLLKGVVGTLRPPRRDNPFRWDRPQGHCLSPAAGRHRPQLSRLGLRFGRHGIVAEVRGVRRIGQRRRMAGGRSARGRWTDWVRAAAHRNPFRGADAAVAVRPAAAAGRIPDSSRRAVYGHGFGDGAGPDGACPTLAWREKDRACRASRSGPSAIELSGSAASWPARRWPPVRPKSC